MTDKTQPDSGRATGGIVEMLHARIAELKARVQELGAMARENRSRRIVELEAQLDSIRAGGVQALSAAPAVPNGDELRRIARSARTSASDDASPTEYVLAGWKAAMLAASPTPPAEQQAAPKAAPGEPDGYKQALGSNNCMQCCVSYMLGLPVGDVPHFADGGGWGQFARFVESKGYSAVMLPGEHEPEADYLASGRTERGTSHMVVMNDGKLVFDPHPSNAGLSSVQCVWLLAKRAAPQQEAQEPSRAAKTWCSYVAGMIGCYLNESDESTKVQAIAGIIERRLWALPTPQPAPAPLIARSLAEWHEDDGCVAWWAWNGREWAGEPAWIGTPNCEDWPGYHTHWTPHPELPVCAALAAQGGKA